jgi:opacity protein-like surface antigen
MTKGFIMIFDKRTCRQAVLLLLTGLNAGSAFSQPNNFLHSVFDIKQYTPLVTFTAGADFVQAGEDQTLTLLPPYQNHYTNNSSTATVADGGVFLGVERVLTDYLSVQLGVAGYIDEKFSSQGDVWQFASPLFDTLSYSYNINHSRVMFSSKLLTIIPRYQAIHPYVSLELGAAYNRASDYQETPLIPLAVPMAPFENHTQSSFAWALGIGVDYNLNQHIRMGVGYQFADLGEVSLGTTPAASTTETLGISHLYTNQLRFQFTFLV